MALRDKAAQLPLLPGVYLYKDAHGTVIYVGKANNLRSRVRSYFNDDRLADVKTRTLISEARDVEYILLDNNKEALALKNNLIKQWQHGFNILLTLDLADHLRGRMEKAAEETRYEEAGGFRDLMITVEEMEQKQKIAAAEGENTDIFAYYAEPPLVSVNLFHLRGGKIVDRREFFWEDQMDFDAADFFESLLKQIYLDQQDIPGLIHVPADFQDL